MSSVGTVSDDEFDNDDVGKLKPTEVTAVERIYDSHDCPQDMSFMTKFYTRFENKIGAEEWFIQSGSGNKHLLLRFPARIVRSTHDSKLTSYGNKDGDMSKKIKMVWALNLELDGPPRLQSKVKYIENTLHFIQQDRDDDLNTGALGMSDDQVPRVHAFTRRQENGSFLVLVNSNNLFDEVLFSSAGSPVKITRSVLESPAAAPPTGFLPDCSSHTAATANDAPTTPNKKTLTLADFPNPQGRFSSVKNVTASIPVIIPPVRDSQGATITPLQYNSSLTDGLLVDILTTLRMWHIKPDDKNPNGSRAYQLILKHMQVLPMIQDGMKTMTSASPATPTESTSSRGPPESIESSITPLTPTPAPRGGKTAAKHKRPPTDSNDKMTPPPKRALRVPESS
ncbi:hypothetical protein JB92DRAFT_2837757 [Gautieria morchelliformis]|nr:hypothetical protein JB92DRAFT_2837757 [Gautieria morchelliformis]